MQRWFYSKGGKPLGPVTPAQLRELTRRGEISPDDLVQREGSDKWVAAGALSGLFDQAKPAPPTGIIASPPAKKPAPTGITAKPRKAASATAPIPVAPGAKSRSPLVR